jgi:hypothetical protein
MDMKVMEALLWLLCGVVLILLSMAYGKDVHKKNVNLYYVLCLFRGCGLGCMVVALAIYVLRL